MEQNACCGVVHSHGLGRRLWPRLQTALVVMGFKLNLDGVEFFPASGHRRGKRAYWRWTSVSKQQIRYAGGDERCGRRRVGLLNPLSGETHKQGMYLDRWTKQQISNRIKRLARKGRRRARPEKRRNAKTSQNVARARSRTGELNIATWNVRSLSLTGRRGAGHAEVLLQKCKVLGCDVIGLQETRRPGRTEFATAGYRVFCSGVDGSTGRAGQHELVKKFCLTSTQSVPLRVGVKLEEFDEDEKVGNWPFRESVGSLMWLSISTRPDIANAVRAVARYCTAPRAIHWKAALSILEYINGISEYRITSQRRTLSGISLEVFADADYASKATDRRSVSG